MKRRTLLAGAGAVGLSGLAGCLGDVTEHEADAYGVEEPTAESADYDLVAVDDVVIEEDVGLGPIEETVVATNYVVEYETTVDMGPLGEQRGGVFVTFSTPQVSVAGREFNPVADMDNEELVELVQSNYDDLDDVEHETDADVEILGETTTRSRFVGEAEFDGTDVEVDVHVSSAVEAGEDLVVTIGVYPRELRDDEEPATVAMMEGVDPAVVDASMAGGGEDGDGEDDGSGDEDDAEGDETNGDEETTEEEDDDDVLD